MNTRNSKVEAIKILAVILIVLGHATPDSVTFADGTAYANGIATGNILGFAVSFLSGLGLVGDVIFIVCSSYYLLESKRVKPSKIVTMILNSVIISLIFLAVVLSIGFKLGAFTIVRQFFPTVFQNNWFISYYIVFYLLHPLLNKIIAALDKTCLAIAAAMLFVHCFILLYVQGEAPGINKLICFVAIYFIVAYFKYYGERFMKSVKLNVALLIISVFVYIALRIAVNILGLHLEYFYDKGFAFVHINCPVILVFALSLFNLANLKTGANRTVNYLSSLSLLVYLIHHNFLLAEYIQPLYFERVAAFGADYLVLWALALAAVYFIGSILLATVYRFTLERATRLAGRKADEAIFRLIEKRRSKLSA